MQKEISIVRVDTRNYRRIAQDNWGLTRQQMKGMHVHHRIPRSQGGTNDPSNLYVCSSWFHRYIWHAEDGCSSLIAYAVEGGRKGGLKVGKRVGLQHKVNKTGVCDPVNQAKSIESQRRQKLGFFNPDLRTRPDVVEMLRQNGKKAGDLAVASGQLAEARKKVDPAKWRKPVEVTSPAGEVFLFESLTTGARKLHLDPGALSQVARGKRDNVKGYRARYLQ